MYTIGKIDCANQPVRRDETMHELAQRLEQAETSKVAMKTFTSGAKSTVVKPRYDLNPQIALELMAERFAYGATRHGARNYRKGRGDQEFITDRINHMMEHMIHYAEHRKRSDLAAILCNAAILADVGAFTDDNIVDKP